MSCYLWRIAIKEMFSNLGYALRAALDASRVSPMESPLSFLEGQFGQHLKHSPRTVGSEAEYLTGSTVGVKVR
jgi:hypothetical protein